MTSVTDLIAQTRELAAEYKALNDELTPLMKQYDAEIRAAFPKPATYTRHVVHRSNLVHLPSATIYDLDIDVDYDGAEGFEFKCWGDDDGESNGVLPYAWVADHDAYMADLRAKVTAAEQADADGKRERAAKRLADITAEADRLRAELAQ